VAVTPRPSAACRPQATPIARVTRQPWAQRALAFASAWRLTRGRGVKVAVVDSGVDYSPQLAGRVTAVSLRNGYADCAGHGTAVAGIIAGSDRRQDGLPFTGVAPAARILSVKVNQGDRGSTALLAAGIRDAALLGAGVINVSVTAGNSPLLASAVRFAQRRDAVIVAAGGNDTPAGGGSPASTGPFYPASYPGVVSVGAVTAGGALASFSDQRSRVAVTAPGLNVTSTWPGGYQAGLAGTSFATAFVSGVAALVRARFPRLHAAAVVRRIEATADGAAGPGTGAGLVNPLQAVTAMLPAAAAATPPPGTPGPVPVATAPAPPRLPVTAALTITGAALGGAAVAAAAALVVSRGRRRRWRATRTTIPRN
jgi:type VII secretion-associated serine protease mycosin